MAEGRRFGSGVRWSYLQSLIARGITSFSFLIVGIFVGPEEFGLYSLVAGVLVMAEMLCEQSLSQTIVQMQCTDDERLTTVFYISLSVSGLITIVMVVGAPYLVSIFGSTRVASLLFVAAACPVLMALSTVPLGVIRRELDFKLLTKRTVVASGLSSMMGIVLVIAGYGAGGLVAQTICYYLVSTIMLWRHCAWRPTSPRKMVGSKIVMRLAGANAVGKLLDFIETRGIEMMVGAIAGVPALGVYAFASKIAQTAFQTLVTPVLEVVFAGVARAKGMLSETIQLGQLIIATLPALGLFGLACGAEPLLTALYGNRWDAAALPLAILASALLVRAFLYVYGVSLQALGLSAVSLTMTTIRMSVCVSIGYAALQFDAGPTGAAMGYLLGSVFIMPITLLYLSAKMGISVRESFLIPLKVFGSGAIALILFFIVRFFSPIHFDLFSVSVCATIFSSVCFFAGCIASNAERLDKFLMRSEGSIFSATLRKLWSIIGR